jgi:hypothetical protein
MLSYLIDKLKSVLISEGTQDDITGYVLMNNNNNNNNNNKSLVLVKENDKYWKTKWIENSKITNELPAKNLDTVFSPTNS